MSIKKPSTDTRDAAELSDGDELVVIACLRSLCRLYVKWHDVVSVAPPYRMHAVFPFVRVPWPRVCL
jgi:hypothetical protein